MTEMIPNTHHSNTGKSPSNRNHHIRTPQSGTACSLSAEQRRKLSAAQSAYVANDPRWPEHRQKLAEAQIARRMTLFPNEIEAILKLRAKGRTFSYIQEEIGICRDVIRRELTRSGYSTAPVRADKRAQRGKGFWRCFEE